MLVALVLLLQTGASMPRAAPRASSLAAAAQASVRPRECAPAPPSAASSLGTNVWTMARDPNLADYCEQLARGYGQLPLSPKVAQETADLAERTLPGHAGPWVLRGRAYTLLEAYEPARVAFEEARGIDKRSLEDPETMREWARALAHTDRSRESLTVYRALGPRLALLPSADDRARTFLEAAELSFSLGPPAVDDAIAFLSEARRSAAGELAWRVGSELALALDRAGRRSEALGVASDLTRRFHTVPKAVLSGENPEETAAAALVLETTNPRQALLLWTRYLAADRPAFAEHAQKRLDALRKKGG